MEHTTVIAKEHSNLLIFHTIIKIIIRVCTFFQTDYKQKKILEAPKLVMYHSNKEKNIYIYIYVSEAPLVDGVPLWMVGGGE